MYPTRTFDVGSEAGKRFFFKLKNSVQVSEVPKLTVTL